MKKLLIPLGVTLFAIVGLLASLWVNTTMAGMETYGRYVLRMNDREMAIQHVGLFADKYENGWAAVDREGPLSNKLFHGFWFANRNDVPSYLRKNMPNCEQYAHLWFYQEIYKDGSRTTFKHDNGPDEWGWKCVQELRDD